MGNFTARVGPLLPVCMVPDWQLFALNLHVQALVRGWIFGATTATKGVNCQVWEVGVIGAELGASGHGMPFVFVQSTSRGSPKGLGSLLVRQGYAHDPDSPRLE